MEMTWVHVCVCVCVRAFPFLVQGVVGSTLQLHSASEVASLDRVVSVLSAEPRFLVVRPTAGTFAVCMFVPEAAKPGVKMVRAAFSVIPLDPVVVQGTVQSAPLPSPPLLPHPHSYPEPTSLPALRHCQSGASFTPRRVGSKKREAACPTPTASPASPPSHTTGPHLHPGTIQGTEQGTAPGWYRGELERGRHTLAEGAGPQVAPVRAINTHTPMGGPAHTPRQ